MLTILNDTHIGTKRMAGTTPASQLALKQWTCNNLAKQLSVANGQDILILGDLFDSFSVDLSDVVSVFHIFVDYCSRFPSATLRVAAGNHDLSKTSSTMSSFLALKGLLKHNKQIQFITEPTMTSYGYVIPHLVNQEVFSAALANVPATEYLFLHCNYDNGFAAQSDHSLNLSAEVADSLPVKYIIMGHEHASRQLGKLWIPGVQWPTSVSDCMACAPTFNITTLTKKGPKFSLSVVDDSEPAIYGEVKVFDDSSVTPDDKFIRVVGTLEKSRLEEALKWVNNLRKNHNAFVITNAVKFVDGEDTFTLDSVGAEVKTFDVLSAVRETLTTSELEILDSVC